MGERGPERRARGHQRAIAVLEVDPAYTTGGIKGRLRCWRCRIAAELDVAGEKGQGWCARDQQRAMAVLEGEPAYTAGHPGTAALLALPRCRWA